MSQSIAKQVDSPVLSATDELRPIRLLNLANQLREQGDFEQAAAALREAIGLRPDWAPAHFVLAQISELRDDVSTALAGYRRTIELKPHCVEAHESLAALLARLGQFHVARLHYEQAAILAPDNFATLNNLGTTLQALGRIEDAIGRYEQALRIKPDCAEALVNLASARTKRRDFAAAADSLRQALRILPDSSDIQNRLGQAHVALGELDSARDRFASALRQQPNNLFWQLRLDTLGPAVSESNSQIDQYQRQLSERLVAHCGEKRCLSIDDLPASDCKPPVELLYQGRDDLAIRRKFATIFTESLPALAPPRGRGKPAIGFHVPHGSEGIFLRGMGGVLTRLTPGRFRTAVICAAASVEKLRASLGDAVEYLRLAGTFSVAIETVRSAALDLVYFWEVGSDATSYFLPFFRLAAVQCTSWGWPVTSGIPQMDFFISSSLLETPEAEAHYSERLVRLRNIPNYYERPTGPTPTADRTRFGLAAEAHLYVCPQNPRKTHPDFDDLAGDILTRDRLGQLLLIEARWPHVTQTIRERFARRWPDCANRLHILPRMVRGDYLTLLATADVVLDTVHYSGGANSTYDALSVCTPIVTFPTALHRGRYTAAVYRAMGITRCVAESPRQYAEIAVRLATEPNQRLLATREIEATRGVLFDNLAAVRELEDFFEQAIVAARG